MLKGFANNVFIVQYNQYKNIQLKGKFSNNIKESCDGDHRNLGLEGSPVLIHPCRNGEIYAHYRSELSAFTKCNQHKLLLWHEKMWKIYCIVAAMFTVYQSVKHVIYFGISSSIF